MPKRRRRVAILIALSFLLAACQAGSLPSLSVEDKTLGTDEQAAVEPPAVDEAEPGPGETAEAAAESALAAPYEEAASASDDLALADLTEAIEAEAEQAPGRQSGAVKVGLLLPLTGNLAREGRRFSTLRNGRCSMSPTRASCSSRAIPAAPPKAPCWRRKACWPAGRRFCSARC